MSNKAFNNIPNFTNFIKKYKVNKRKVWTPKRYQLKTEKCKLIESF